jgi:hypothetical protein
MDTPKTLRPISTIKMIRQLTGCGLKEAKDLVYALRDGDIQGYATLLEKVRAQMYSPDVAELQMQVETVHQELNEANQKLYTRDCAIDSLQRNLNEANVEATAREKYIAILKHDRENLEEEVRRLRQQPIVKAPLIDRELAKKLIRCQDQNDFSGALDLILEAAMPTEVPLPTKQERFCKDCIHKDTPHKRQPCEGCFMRTDHPNFIARTCTNCDPGSNEEACNSCHNFSNWREDTCPF